MILLHVRVVANPLVAELHTFGAAGEHPTEQVVYKLGVAFVCLARLDGSIDLHAGGTRVVENARCAAIDNTR